MEFKLKVEPEVMAKWEETLTVAKELGLLWRKTVDKEGFRKLWGGRSVSDEPDAAEDPRMWPPPPSKEGLISFLRGGQSWRAFAMEDSTTVTVAMTREMYDAFQDWQKGR